MKIRFYLAVKTAKRSSIVLTIREGAAGRDLKTVRIGTGLIVETRAWDTEKERVKRNYEDGSRINRKLDDIAKTVQDLADAATRLLKTDPLPYIKAELPKAGVLDRPVPTEQAPAPASVLHYFDTFIEERKIYDADSTVKRYRVVYNHLKTFLGNRAARFGFDSITPDFYNELVGYFFNVANLTNNTVGRHLEMIKCFLHWATEKGHNTNLQYRKLFRRSDFERDATTIALTDDELRRIEELDLADDLRLNNVRDLFVIGCLTGMRCSDVAQIKPEHIQDGFIRLHVTKTTEKLAIPLTPRLKRVLEKYHPDYAFRSISSQKMNNYLKEIGQLAELNDTVEIVRYKGAEKVATTGPKYTVLSTHAARRTFITLSLQKKVQPEIVMKVSGHTDMRSFRKYIKHANEYVKDEMIRAWE